MVYFYRVSFGALRRLGLMCTDGESEYRVLPTRVDPMTSTCTRNMSGLPVAIITSGYTHVVHGGRGCDERSPCIEGQGWNVTRK